MSKLSNAYIFQLAILIAIISCSGPKAKNKEIDKSFEEKLDSVIQSTSRGGAIVDLSSVFTFDWDEVIIPRSYIDISVLENEYNGINEKMKRVQFDDSRSLLMFCTKKEIGKYIFIGKARCDFSPQLGSDIAYFERDSALFTVDIKTNDNGKKWIQIVPIHRPPASPSSEAK